MKTAEQFCREIAKRVPSVIGDPILTDAAFELSDEAKETLKSFIAVMKPLVQEAMNQHKEATVTPIKQKPKQKFKIGQRVQLIDKGKAFAMENGIIVAHRGKRTLTPRVRWASGWATSCDPETLRRMADKEMRRLPRPELSYLDYLE